MSEKPILFSGEMVNAILDGRKTQTRRVMKPQPEPFGSEGGVLRPLITTCPYGYIGDHLWVRETWRDAGNGKFLYRATPPELQPISGLKWKPSIFMPRRACRLMLEVTGVRVERLRDICESDAEAEGVEAFEIPIIIGDEYVRDQQSFTYSFHQLWNKINGKKHPWESSPWVWVIEFQKT